MKTESSGKSLRGVDCACGDGHGNSQPGEKEGAAPPKILHFGDLKWTPIFKGCDLAAVAGDPNAEGNAVRGAPSVR